jgi:hypothetical protein
MSTVATPAHSVQKKSTPSPDFFFHAGYHARFHARPLRCTPTVAESD